MFVEGIQRSEMCFKGKKGLYKRVSEGPQRFLRFPEGPQGSQRALEVPKMFTMGLKGAQNGFTYYIWMRRL